VTEPQRLRLFRALMHKIPTKGAGALPALEDMILEDIKAIEPIIDEIAYQAALQARVQALMELTTKHWERGEVLIQGGDWHSYECGCATKASAYVFCQKHNPLLRFPSV